jgi:DNA-binding NarL/FixJ family response regulator
VLAFDLRAPSGSLPPAIGWLHAGWPTITLVLMTMDTGFVLADRSLSAGACGVVCQDRADTELPVTVRAAAGGHRDISPGLTRRL